MVSVVAKQKIFSQLYVLWDIQGWTCTSQFHFPTSSELWDTRAVDPILPLVSDVGPKPLVSEGLILPVFNLSNVVLLVLQMSVRSTTR